MAVLVAREARPEGGYVARITIDNEAKLNTINRVLAVEIVETIKQFDQPIIVRVVVDRDRALVESRRGEQATTLWSGAHGLAPDKPRYAGVRFIRGSGGGEDVATVRSMRVLTRGAASAGPSGATGSTGGRGGRAGGR